MVELKIGPRHMAAFSSSNKNPTEENWIFFLMIGLSNFFSLDLVNDGFSMISNNKC